MWLRRFGYMMAAMLLSLAGGCFQRGENQELLPMSIGEWRRVAVENIPAEEHSSELKRMGIKRTRRGIYAQGGTKVTASVYEYGAPAVAFELVQKFRPQPGRIAMHKGRYFVVLESAVADATARDRFASQLEGVLTE